MRRPLALSVGAAALIVVVAWTTTRSSPTATPSPSPTPITAPPTSTTAAATSTPASIPTPTGIPIAFGAPATLGGVSVRPAVEPVTPSRDVHYVVAAQGNPNMYVTMLDLGTRVARSVAQVDLTVPPGSQTAPSVSTSATADGRTVLISVTEADGRTHIFVHDVERATVRALATLPRYATAVISPDGSRFAFNDRSEDPARTGVWVGNTADGSSRRIVADEPGRAGSPPPFFWFSPDGRQLALTVALAQGDTVTAVVPSDLDPEGSVDAAGRTVRGATSVLRPGGNFSWLRAPDDVWIWEHGTPGGHGLNAIFRFDLATGKGRLLYRPPEGQTLHYVERHPSLDRYATQESGAPGTGAIWIRTLAGAATKVADTGMIGPSLFGWSSDGSRLYAFGGGDDSVGVVVDLVTGDGVLSYCLRSPSGPGVVCV